MIKSNHLDKTSFEDFPKTLYGNLKLWEKQNLTGKVVLSLGTAFLAFLVLGTLVLSEIRIEILPGIALGVFIVYLVVGFFLSGVVFLTRKL